MEEVETEVENMECLEDPGVEDTENFIGGFLVLRITK